MNRTLLENFMFLLKESVMQNTYYCQPVKLCSTVLQRNKLVVIRKQIPFEIFFAESFQSCYKIKNRKRRRKERNDDEKEKWKVKWDDLTPETTQESIRYSYIYIVPMTTNKLLAEGSNSWQVNSNWTRKATVLFYKTSTWRARVRLENCQK